jgi:hypothetical protein
MDDLITSFKAHLYDRVTSPLLSSFLISWVLWNHRLFAVMMSSDLKILEKFYYIDHKLYPGVDELCFRGMLWPLLSALLLIFVYPIPARWVYEYVRKEQKALKQIQQRIEEETPLTVEESRKLRALMRDAARSFDEQIQERDNEILSLKKDVEESRTPTASESVAEPVSTASADVLGIVLSLSQLEVLEKIANNDVIKDSELRYEMRASSDFVRYQFDIDRLLENKLMMAKSVDGDRLFASTAAGRALLMQTKQSRETVVAIPR